MALTATEQLSGGKVVDTDQRTVVVVNSSNGGPGSGAAMYPTGAVPVTAHSGNVAAATATATLSGTASATTYITGFQVTAAGATAALVVNVTVVGTISGTMTYTFAAPAGATVAATPLIVEFPSPVPASAVNTAIIVSMPTLGAGNTNAAINAQGFRL